MIVIWTKYFYDNGNWVQVVTGHEDVAPPIIIEKVVSISQEIRMSIEEYNRFKDQREL